MPKPKKSTGLNTWSVADSVESAADGTRPLRLRVVGVGGAAIHALTNIKQGERIAVDTDGKALRKLEGIQPVRIGETLLRGLSACGDAALGRQAAETDAETLRAAIAGAEVVVVIAGLGGGTGSGAAPWVAQLAQQTGALTLSIALIPFEFEPSGRRDLARIGVASLRAVCDATLSISHDALFTAAGDHSSAEDAFRRAESLVGEIVTALDAMLTGRGMGEISLDELRKAWGSNHSELSFGIAQGSLDAQLSFATPTCSVEIISEADHLFVHLRGPDLRLSEIQGVTEQLRTMNPGARISLCASAGSDQPTLVIFAARSKPADETAVANLPAPTLGAAFTPSPKKNKKPQQQTLPLDTPTRGRFEQSEPTIYDGEDLDIPTFLRKHVRLVEK